MKIEAVVQRYLEPTIYALIMVEVLVVFYNYKLIENTSGTIFALASLLALVLILEIDVFKEFGQRVISSIAGITLACQVIYVVFFA